MIQEVIFQGIFNTRSPVRLELTEPFVQLNLPSTVQAEHLKILLTSLFYPERLDNEQRRQVELGQDVKIAVVFEAAGHIWRILRREDDASLRLQLRDTSSYRDVAQGLDVPRALQEKLRFAPYPLFSSLNLWRLDEALPAESERLSLTRLDEKTRTIVTRYRDALEIEALEDQVRAMEELKERTRQRLGEGAKLEDNLERAQSKMREIEIAELSKEDLKLLNEREERLGGYAQQILRLEAEEEQEREELNVWLPDKPWKNQYFWVGVVLAAVTIGLSVVMKDTMRPLAAGNVIGLGMSAWVLLRYFSDMERASVHIVRLDSIKRRLTQVKEEQVAFRERIGHLLVHAGVGNEAELLERFEKSSKLGEMIARMQEQLDKIRARPNYQQAKREIAEVERDLQDLRQRRASLGQSTFTAYQLERDLINLGVDPEQALGALNDDSPSKEQPAYERDLFTRLAELARRSGLLTASGELDPRVKSMWAKICGHVMGPRFKAVDLSAQGQLQIAGLHGEQLEMWSRTRPRELRAVAMGLAIAMVINLPTKLIGPNTVVLSDPAADLSSEHAQKMIDVLRSAARQTRIMLIK